MNDQQDTRLLAKAIEAIATASTTDAHELTPELSAALFWGIAHLAAEAADRMEATTR